MLRFASLASGSGGNCLVAQADLTRVLIDCGLSLTDTERRLARLGLEPADIDAILVTHEHGDHAGCSFDFAACHNVRVILTLSWRTASVIETPISASANPNPSPSACAFQPSITSERSASIM